MIQALLRFSLRRRFVIVALALALVGLGLWALQQLRIEAYPDLSDTQAVVITTYPGHAAEEVEQQVTVPVERALNGVPAVIARRSRTIFGLSVVELTFAYGTDDYFARQVVLEKLRDAELPDGVTPTLGPMATPVGELYRYVVEGKGYSTLELRELQDWVIDPRFRQAPGVADVTPFGGLVKQYQVDLAPGALVKYNLSISQIAAAVSANNQNGGGALLDNGQQSMVIRGVGLIQGTEDVENIVVAAARGVPVYLRDLGKVKIGWAPPTGVFGLRDQAGIEGIVLMRRGENPSEVLQGLHEAVEDINANRLPPGVRIRPIYDRTDLIANTLRTVSRTLLEALVVMVFMLLLFLGSVRAALLTALTIPLSLLFAFVCMHFTGIPANLLSLGALDFGIIVDGTLVMVEHIALRLHTRKAASRDAVFENVLGAALEMGSPIFFSVLIIVAAYLPLFTLERVEGRLFSPMAYTVCFALVGALILSLTLVPVLATWLFRGGATGWENPLLRWLYDRYENVLRFTVKRAAAVVAAGAAVVVAACALAGTLGSEFLPQLDEGTIWIRCTFPAGLSLAKSAEEGSHIRHILERFPEVQLASSQSGRNDAGTDPFGPNRNEFFVALKPYDTWPKGKRKADVVEEISRALRAEIPGANFSLTQPIIDMVTEAVTGSSADLAVIISGPDLDRLRGLADRTLTVLKSIPGAEDTFLEQESDQAQLRIAIDRRAVARYGINVRDVQDIIEMAIGGKPVSTIFQDERRFDLALRFEQPARADADAIGEILVPTREGGRVPLAQLARIEVVNGASIIARRENIRQISVRTNIRGRDQGGYVREAQRKFAKAVKLPGGYSVSWGGQFENLDRARRRLSIVLPLTIAIIFALLFLQFGSAGLAGLVLVNVPFSLVGGIIFLYLRGINLSVSAAVGFISLFGVAVMSGILCIAEINRRRAEPGTSLEDAVVLGARAQLRPSLMLILVAMFGMVPAMQATGIGSDIQRPLATVLVGGLLSTLLLSLLVLPSLYYITARRGRAS